MTTIKVPDTPNLTLVAFYEKKRDLKSIAFAELIQSIQKWIGEVLQPKGVQDTFVKYDRKQVHATILGCEGGKTNGRVLSKWFWEKRTQQRYINCEQLLTYFRWYSNLPIAIRFCAYSPDTNYGFSSQNLHPYIRSFQIRDDKTAILMGWPYRAGQWTLALDQFRLGAQKCNALHKFHCSVSDVDNDCYLRIGYFTELPPKKIRDAIEREVRTQLASMTPIYEVVDRTTLVLARYSTTALKLKTTETWELDEITAQDMADLYPEAIP
ncbi:MAG: hypothetical protein AB4290_23675 [Spirulina sp.]